MRPSRLRRESALNGPVEAEHVLQPLDLGDAAGDEAARAGCVRIVQDDLGDGAEG